MLLRSKLIFAMTCVKGLVLLLVLLFYVWHENYLA